jgi:hypothetical protein
MGCVLHIYLNKTVFEKSKQNKSNKVLFTPKIHTFKMHGETVKKTKVIFTLLTKLFWNNFFLNYRPNLFHCSPSYLGGGG